MASKPVSREAAEHLKQALSTATGALEDAFRVVLLECEPEFAADLKFKLADAITMVNWDILEVMVYADHPDLRPYKAGGSPISSD